jgi:prepilin-type N-terminal cleavage/methylation domain-containing protein
MNASCTERGRGFTAVELVAVLILIGVLAAVALPRLGVIDAFRSQGWREQVVAGLRLAQSTATGHRRLVCASFTGSRLSLQVATGNPASSCTAALRAPDGQSNFDDTAPAAGTAVAVSPSGTLYFQPDGRVTSDGAGASTTSFTITATGLATITVHGASGHVE